MSEDRPGKAFEKLVATIESALAAKGGRTVEYDKRIAHLVTGRKRQFDVVVTQGEGHHRTVTVIECKDHGRPLDVEAVEAFIKKVEGCDVHRGILVASNGFSEDARKVAAASKIAVMTLQEAEAFDWIAMKEGAFAQLVQKFEHIDVEFVFDSPAPILDELFARGAKFVDQNDKELTNVALSNLLGPHVNWDQFVPGGDPVEVRFRDLNPSASILEVDGERWRPKAIEITARVRVAIEPLKVSLHTYGTPLRDLPIASTEVQAGEHSFRLVLVRNEDETTDVMIVRSPTKGTT